MGRRRGMGRFMEKRSSAFKIQITSMVDMFVILLVFLIKSYSTSPVQISPSKDMTLPASTSTTAPVDVLKLKVSKNGVFVEDKKILDLESGIVKKNDLDPTDEMMITELYKALDQQAEKSRGIASVNTELKFEGKIMLQADRNLPYSLLQKVMYTSMLAGYADLKLAVLN